MIDSETAEQIELISEHVRPMLRGHGPAVEGAILATLVATFIAGYVDDAVRQRVMTDWIEFMRYLVARCEADIVYPDRVH